MVNGAAGVFDLQRLVNAPPGRLARQQLHDEILARLAPDMASITGAS